MLFVGMVLVPLIVGAWLVVAGSKVHTDHARLVSLGAVTIAASCAIGAAVVRPEVDAAWIPELGVRRHFVVDGISAPLVVLTAIVGVLVVLHAWVEQPWVGQGRAGTYLGSLLVVIAGALATFAAGDAVLFFIAFEVVLVPMWLIIRQFGDRSQPAVRRDAAMRFVLFTALGSTLMLVGIVLLVVRAGTADLDSIPMVIGDLGGGEQALIAALLVVGLAVKVPVFPLHTWLPPAHTCAPTAGSVLLAAVLLKMGTYGLVRLPLAAVPDGFARVAPALAICGVVGIIWGGLICLVERDLKRLIAYSSVAHMGFVVLGLASMTTTGLQAALVGNIAHGVVAALLFVIVGLLKNHWGSVDLGVVRPALREVAPGLGFALILGLAAALGLPGLAGFWGEFLALLGGWSSPHHVGLMRVCVVVAAIGAALAAAYCLRVARLVWVGDAVRPDESRDGELRSLGGPINAGIVAVLVLAIVIIGVAPDTILSVSADAAQQITGQTR